MSDEEVLQNLSDEQLADVLGDVGNLPVSKKPRKPRAPRAKKDKVPLTYYRIPGEKVRISNLRYSKMPESEKKHYVPVGKRVKEYIHGLEKKTAKQALNKLFIKFPNHMSVGAILENGRLVGELRQHRYARKKFGKK
jgi:hypothetical protein